MSVKSALRIKINGQWVAVPVIAGEGSGGEGAAGADGGYYTPAVSSEGLLSWTPSKDGMPAVASADIRGPKGDTGSTGDTGPAGSDGAPGKDGTSVTVASVNTSSEDGGSNVVTFSDGKTLTVKNGSKGSTGDQGPAGSDGTSVTVKSVSTSSEDGGSNVVTFSDGKTLTVKNGSKGSQGEPGYTPQKGVDYRDGVDGKNGTDGKNAFTAAVSVTVPSTSWAGAAAPFTATVTCNGVTASNHIIVGAGGALTAEQQAAMAAAMIVCTGQGANSITLSSFGTVPSIDLPVNVMIVG